MLIRLLPPVPNLPPIFNDTLPEILNFTLDLTTSPDNITFWITPVAVDPEGDAIKLQLLTDGPFEL